MKHLYKSLVMIAAAAITLAGCTQKEVLDTPNDGELVTLKFNIRNADEGIVTKALLGTENGKNFLNWENGDKIGAFSTGSTNSNNRPGTVEVSGDNYTLNIQTSSAQTVNNIYSYYPYSNSAGTDKSNVSVTIPEMQKMTSSGFDADAMPMAGEPVDVNISTTQGNKDYECGDINFANLGSIIKFRVYSSTAVDEKLVSVKYITSGGLGGVYTIDLTGVDFSDERTLELESTSESYAEITTTVETKPAIGTGVDNAYDVFMVVAPGTYSSTSVVVTTSKHTYTLSASGDKTFARSHVKPMKVDIQNGTQGDLPPVETWEETTLAALGSSDIFVIVGENTDGTFAMSNNNGTGTAPSAVSVTVAESKITSDVASNSKWNISGNATDGYVFYPNGSTTTWLYCTNTNNGVRVGTNDNKFFKIDSDFLYNVATSRYVGIQASTDWRCYTSINSNITGQTFKFYKRVLTAADTRDDAPISWSAASSTANLGESFTAPTLTNDESLTVTYASSETTVATINASTGAITIQGVVGTTTISAEFAGNANYKPTTVSYTLTVNDNRSAAPISWSDTDGAAEITDTEIVYVLPTLNNTESLDVTYASSDETVATIGTDGTVTALKAGTTTISATYSATTSSTYKSNTVEYELEVTDSRTPTTHYYVKVTSTSDITDGDYLIVYETGNVAFNGGLATLDGANNTISVSIGTNGIESTSTTDAAKFTINVSSGTIQSASGYYIGVTSYGNGLKQNENSATYGTHVFNIDSDGNANIYLTQASWNSNQNGKMSLRYNKNTSDNRFRYYKETGQQPIQLYKLN